MAKGCRVTTAPGEAMPPRLQRAGSSVPWLAVLLAVLIAGLLLYAFAEWERSRGGQERIELSDRVTARA
jgi:hypothetical protein